MTGKLLSILWIPAALHGQTCPDISFLRAADVTFVGGNYSNGYISGLERLADGSLTLYRFTGNTSSAQQSTTPQYQSNFYNCIGLPPRGSSPPAGWHFLADRPGVTSVNPLITDLVGNGLSTAIGVTPYSTDTKKLTVGLATANKTAGPRYTYDVPQNPASLLSADLNNDGKRDVISIASGPFTNPQGPGIISVFPGNGDGTLGARKDTNAGMYPEHGAVWDFNSDGKMDLVVASGGSNSILVLLGKGDGTFQTPTSLDSSSPQTVAVADVNKDGKGDLIIGGGSGVTVRLGGANAGFGAAATVFGSFTIAGVAVGDFNKDGNPDIAAASSIGAFTVILLGNGTGGFTNAGSYITSYGARQMYVYDFDWDGNPDIVFGAGHPDALTAAGYGMTVTVLFGRGDGTFHGASAMTFYSLSGMTTGDFNGDGKVDAVASYSPFPPTTDNITVGLNDGSGALRAQQPVTIQDNGFTAYLSDITSGDYNNDGKRDIAAAGSSNIYVLRGNGNGTFQSPQPFRAGNSVSRLASGDFNGDSRADLVFTDTSDNKVYLALSSGNGAFQAPGAVSTGTNPRDVAAADVNGDGRLDVIVVYFGDYGSSGAAGSIQVLLGNGSGGFQAPINLTASAEPVRATVGDLNGDGKPDLVVSTADNNFHDYLGILLGNGNGTFQSASLIGVDFGPSQSALADFNGDGKVDILLGHCCGEVSMGVLVGNGNGTFQAETLLTGAGVGGSFVSAADLNLDGRADGVVGIMGNGGTYITSLINVNGGAVITDCTYSLNRTKGQASALGDTLGVNVIASQSSCAWNATSGAGWVTFGGTLPRSGTGTLRIAVASNPGTARSAALTIAGQNFTLDQAAGGCGFTLNPSALTAASGSSNYNLTVATQAGCGWSPAVSQDWIAITSGNPAIGPGTAAYTVAGNGTGAVRTGSVSVAGEFQQIIQPGENPTEQFTDVPVSHIFYNYISVMRARSITSGCTTTTYCPDAVTTRGQMAVFIIRAIYNGDSFNYSSTPYFTDVAAGHPFFKWIQKMRELGITSGCTTTAYCPDDAVTRGQMAVFVVRARLGLSGGDPLAFPANAFFTDVPSSYPFFSYIQKMRQLAVTSGCTATTYCPDASTTRGQMAVFIVRGLLTP